MLGEDIWKETQNKIMSILSNDHNNVIYHFINEELSQIKSIVIHQDQLTEGFAEPEFIEKLKSLTVLKLQIVDRTEYLTPQIGDF